jgi:hypothetical protein
LFTGSFEDAAAADAAADGADVNADAIFFVGGRGGGGGEEAAEKGKGEGGDEGGGRFRFLLATSMLLLAIFSQF